MADIARVAQELAAETQPDETLPAPASAALADAPALASNTVAEGAELIGALNADQRIRSGTERSERILWVSALLVTLLYVGVIAAQVMNLGGLSALEHELQQQERERRGQGSDSISVEIVPEPDFKSKTEKWQEGANGPPTPNPPQPQQQAALPRPMLEEQPQQEAEQKPEEKKPEEQKPEEKKPEEQEAEKPRKGDSGQPSLPDLEALVDAAANDLAEKVKEHYENKPSRPQRQQQATISGGGMQVRGVGAGGKSDEFSKSVINALLKTRPGPFALWGRVLVSFQITQQGDLLYVHVLKSSGNKAMDDAAVDAIHRAKFIKPPPDLPAEARTYIIDYVFG